MPIARSVRRWTVLVVAYVAFLVGLVGLAASFGLAVQPESDEKAIEVWFGEELAVSYAARVEGGWLVLEVHHEPGWHTYAMDNYVRAREKTGKAKPDTELPTRLEPQQGLRLAGVWRQSAPIELHQPELGWYTWGFEGTSYFAAPLQSIELPSSVRVDAQACTESQCAMVDALLVPVETGREDRRSIDPKTLVESRAIP